MDRDELAAWSTFAAAIASGWTAALTDHGERRRSMAADSIAAGADALLVEWRKRRGEGA